MSPHGMGGQYSEAPLSASLPSLASDYSISTVTSPYGDNYFPSSVHSTPYGGSSAHYRTSSTSGYDAPRQYKRPRANTSNAALYSSHEAASLLNDMSRSISDHGSSTRLPSLTETYGMSDSRYGTQEQATPGTTQSRSSYDFGAYLDGAQDSRQQGDLQSAVNV